MKRGNFYLDNANLLNHLKLLSGSRSEGGKVLDYGRLCLFVKNHLEELWGEPIKVEEVKLYDGIVKNDAEKKLKKARFIFSVERRVKEALGEEVVFKPYLFEVFLGKNKKVKGDDVQLALDACNDIKEKKLDFIVLFSGDGDFRSLLETLKEKHPHTAVAVTSFSSFCSKGLRSLSDLFIDLEEALEEVAFA